MEKVTGSTLITAKMLQEAKACKSNVRVFKKEWPKGTRITKKACFRANELELDIGWFASIFLSTEDKREWNKLERKINRKYPVGSEENVAYYKNIAIAFYQVMKKKP